MHSKRNKHKNRQNKVPNPTSQNKTDVVPEDNKVDSKTENKDSDIIHEERVPNIVSESIEPSPTDAKVTEGNVPKKPRRHRGKKKKQDKGDEIFEEVHQEHTPKTTDQTIKTEDDIKFIDDEDEDILNVHVLEEPNVVPTARKKKNKNKSNFNEPPKATESSQNILEEGIKVISDENFIVTQLSTTVEEEEPKLNKKDKKKKQRHDSEKSDKSAEVVSAFQKLLDDKDEDENEKTMFDITSEQIEHCVEDDAAKVDTVDISDITKTEQTEIKLETKESTEIKSEDVIHDRHENVGAISKKKNKKDKKNPPKSKNVLDSDTDKTEEETPASFATIKSKMEIPVKDQSPKPSFETAKTDVTCEKSNKDNLSEITCEASSPVKVMTSESILAESEASVMIGIDVSQEQRDKLKETRDISEQSLEIKSEEIVIMKFDDIVDQIETIDKQEYKNTEFLKAPEKGIRQKRKKSPKPFLMKQDSNKSVKPEESIKEHKTPELEVQEKVEVRSARASESDGSTIQSPDFIEYPRSTSEQHLDDNNNTVIQDISGVQEIKLEDIIIPDKVIIQGSGETPITSPEVAIDSKKDANISPKEKEKTDLKSKVIEVNKDMEELRLSIEKSLAELTAIEKSEEEIEKKYEEKMEAKTEDIKTVTKVEQADEEKVLPTESENKDTNISTEEPKPLEASELVQLEPPVCPPRKDHKVKGKKKKDKQGEIVASASENSSSTTKKETKEQSKKEESREQKSESTQEKGKQQSDNFEEKKEDQTADADELKPDHEFIDNFEDALSSNIDDVQKSLETVANESNHAIESSLKTPDTSVVEPTDNTKKEKNQEKKPVSQPKNLLGHPNIPVPSSKTDYKKEKNRTPNIKHAKVKVKDAEQIEILNKTSRVSKESQTESKLKKSKYGIAKETISHINNEGEEYVYKYSFRKVFLHNTCQVCKKELKENRVSCSFCNLVFYCNQKHKDEDWALHQALCFAVSTIVHLKGQKHIYEDAKNVTGYNYRLLRMQAIVSCEKVLKRRLVPWEQEVLLYPRICSEVACREWKQAKLQDCDGCGQISYCIEHPEHLSKAHQRWCKSHSLYQKMVCYQQTKGRLEPKLPSRVMTDEYQIPEKINEVLASLYQEKIDMNDMQYAALTQLATAPLTAAYCHQIYSNKINSTCANGVCKKSLFTLHVVGAELQFEADGLNKWEVFFLHVRPDVQELKVVLISPDLNPSNLPLNLLGKIKLCAFCRQKNRKLTFDFQDRKTYHDFWSSDDFTSPDLVCAFDPSIERSSYYNGNDLWPSTITSILKLKIPFVVTSFTLTELHRDLVRIKDCAGVEFSVISEPKNNPFASVRPDRNFISDDEMPLLFKNYCYMVICGDI